ncbi:MAG: cytochrome c family protein [Lentisphaeraceae bacterium]|nr:cytochrome c family protein [Lentisphaeraceae bacterium]
MKKSIVKAIVLCISVMGALTVSAQEETTKFKVDPTKVVGAEACIKCHENEGRAWHGTHHFKTYKELHKRKEAKDIAKNLEIKRIKTSKECMACHYTVQQLDAEPSAITGISCESCHGAGKEWIELHQDFGKDKDAKTETPEHRKERLAKIDGLGMIRPTNIYKVAENCYQCHTVPNENLVNVGGHKAGSQFELYTWLNGEIRHNFRTGDGSNKEPDQNKKRLLYVVGQILDMEYAFRGVAKAKAAKIYAKKMAQRAHNARVRLKKVLQAVKVDELMEIYKIAAAQKLKLNNEEALTKAANDISKLGQAFANKYNGSEFPEIDSQIPTELKGTATQ